MNLNTLIFLIISAIFLNSCADYKTDRTSHKIEKEYYSSIGFALIYEDDLYLKKVVKKKINNDESGVMHNLLKVNTPIKIIEEECINCDLCVYICPIDVLEQTNEK